MKILPALSAKPAPPIPNNPNSSDNPNHLPSSQESEATQSPAQPQTTSNSTPGIAPNTSEYEQLKQRLVRYSLGVSVLGSLITWLNYGTNITVSYLVGAAVGLVYLRQLGKSVDQLGRQTGDLAGGLKIVPPRLALVIAMIIVALKWQQLSFLPVFLGFLTYKFAILIYALQCAFPHQDAKQN